MGMLKKIGRMWRPLSDVTVSKPAARCDRLSAIGLDMAAIVAREQEIINAAYDPETETLRWPDDPFEIPAWWYVIEARAERYGLPRLKYKNRAEYEAQDDLCRLTLANEPDEFDEPGIIDLHPDVDDDPPQPALPAQDAARRFLADVRWESRDTAAQCVRYNSRELWSRYLEYCEVENRTPTGRHALTRALKNESGVSIRRLVHFADCKTGARQLVYVIETDTRAAVASLRQAA